MKINKWTLGLAAAGVVSLGSVAQAEEASEHLMTAVSGTQISGYVSTSASWMVGSGRPAAAGGFVGRSFHDNAQKQDGFNLDAIDLTVSKSLDEGEWAAGYKGELWFGSDASAFAGSSTGVNTSEVVIRQAYVELRAPVGNGIDFKVGVFDTIIGYELTNHDANPNFGRSYGWGIEPTTHTGILASYKVTDFLSISAGVANNGVNSNQIGGGTGAGFGKAGVESDKSYMAGFVLTAPEDMGFISGATLSFGVVDTTVSSTAVAANKSDIINWYAGLALPLPIEGWSVGIAYDYRGQSNDNGITAANYANATALYLSAAVTEKLKINVRADYTSATDGTYYVTAPVNDDARNELFALTTTLDYSLWENVISRLEFRWDTALTGGGAAVSRVFGGGPAAGGNTDKNAMTVALNLIYKF
ncbi:MAG TPA: outer membrane beta-barrel protein [Verrucomicrobiae bacterium]